MRNGMKAFLAMALLAVAAAAESVDELLEKGIFQQEGARNYPAAIALFEAALKAPDALRGKTVQTLLRLGQCQAFSGQPGKARATLQCFVQDYAGQIDAIAMLADLAVAGWTDPRQPQPVTPTPVSKTQLLREKLDSIIVPRLEFDKTPMAEVRDILERTSRELDPEKQGINFLWFPEPAAHRILPPEECVITVTMSLTDIPFSVVLESICQDPRLTYCVNECTVSIAHVSVPIQPMETRFYTVAPGVLDTGLSEPRTRDRWGEDEGDDGFEGMRLPTFFGELGVEFLPGSHIGYYQRTGKLTVTNTAEQLEKIERILLEIDVTPTQVSAVFELIEVDNPAPLRGLRPGAVHETVLKALPSGKWHILSRTSLVTLSGNTAVVHEDVPAPDKEQGIRVHAELTPTVAADGYSVDLNLCYTYTEPAPTCAKPLPQSDQSPRLSRALETKLILWDGESMTFQLSGREATDARNIFLIVHVNLLNPAGLPLRPPASLTEKRKALQAAVTGKP